MPNEVSMFMNLLRRHPFIKVLPTSLFIYRLLKMATCDAVLSMRSHPFVPVNADSMMKEIWRLSLSSSKDERIDGHLQDVDVTEAIHRTLTVEQVLLILQLPEFEVSNWEERNGSKHVLTKEVVIEFFQRIKFNPFSVVVGYTPPDVPGEGLYDEPSFLINHSFLPNSRQHFICSKGQAPQLYIDILMPLQAGEEVTISYGEVIFKPVRERRMEIAEKYCFYCRCVRCMNEETS